MNKINFTGISLIMIGFLFAGCKGDGIFDKCGEEKESIVNLTPGDIKALADSLPPGYRFYSWRTNIPSTNFIIHFYQIGDFCLEEPVHVIFEASCLQVPYEGDIAIVGIAGAGGESIGRDLVFVEETTEEILFSSDIVFKLDTIDFLEEEPFFYTGVTFEVRTGGTSEEDLAYLCKVLKQVKVTATYKASR